MNTIVEDFAEKANESFKCDWVSRIFRIAVIENDEEFMKKFIQHFDTFVKMYID